MQNQIKEQLRTLAERIAQTKGKIQSEEATKTAYIMPFLQIMGYDVFDPEEKVPVSVPLDILPLKKHIQDTILKYYQNGKK